MKKINIKNIELDIDMIPLLELKNVNDKIYVDIEGKIYINEEVPKNKAIIYANDNYEKKPSINDIKTLSNDILISFLYSSSEKSLIRSLFVKIISSE